MFRLNKDINIWWPTTVTAKPKTSRKRQKHHGSLGVEFLRTTSKFRKRKKISPLLVYLPHKTLSKLENVDNSKLERFQRSGDCVRRTRME